MGTPRGERRWNMNECQACGGAGRVAQVDQNGRQASFGVCRACEGTGAGEPPVKRHATLYLGPCPVCGVTCHIVKIDDRPEPWSSTNDGIEHKKCREKRVIMRAERSKLEKSLGLPQSDAGHAARIVDAAVNHVNEALPPAPTVPLDIGLTAIRRGIGSARVLAVHNWSTLISNEDARACVDAVQEQLDKDACPAWGCSRITLSYDGQKGPPATEDFIGFVDDAHQAGALGYHPEDDSGREFGFVLVRPILSAGGTLLKGSMSASAVFSHEVLEWAKDPNVNRWRCDKTGEWFYPEEAADAVESNSYE